MIQRSHEPAQTTQILNYLPGYLLVKSCGHRRYFRGLAPGDPQREIQCFNVPLSGNELKDLFKDLFNFVKPSLGKEKLLSVEASEKSLRSRFRGLSSY